MNTDPKRRIYEEAFKRETVRRLMESNESVSSFAVSIGVDRTNLQKWKKIFGPEFMPETGQPDGANDYSRLRREFASLKETVDQLRAVVKKNFENKYIGEE